jgi:hypothetical protein
VGVSSAAGSGGRVGADFFLVKEKETSSFLAMVDSVRIFEEVILNLVYGWMRNLERCGEFRWRLMR